MKKATLFISLLAVLTSQTGCIGSNLQNNFPYATPEIKQQLAERIYGVKEPIPTDFFETQNYFPMVKALMDNEPEVLGATIEQQTFWYYLMSLRALIMDEIAPHSPDDMRMGAGYIMMLSDPFEDFITENPQQGTKILEDVIRYEKTFPYNPQKGVEQEREKIKNMTKAEFLQLSGLPDVTDEQLEKAKQNEMQFVEDVPAGFNQARLEFLKMYEEKLAQLKSGKSVEDFIAEKKQEKGVAEYAINFRAPLLYPAEMIFGEFVLDPENDDTRYSFKTIFLKHGKQSGTIQIEDEKPLPYKIDLAWYAIVENKVYSLEADLPRDILKEKIINSGDKWDAILFTLLPYGKIEMYAYNQVSEKKEKLADFQAGVIDTPLPRFLQYAGVYAPQEGEITDWKQYQQAALKNFPKAAENLLKNGLPLPAPDTNYWEENPENIFPGLPETENINTPDDNGLTPLIEAVRTNKTDAVRALIKAGADVNYQTPAGETALLEAVSKNHLEQAKLLLNGKANVNFQNPISGETPLMIAEMSGNEELVKMLLTFGADVNTKRKINGQELQENALTIAQDNQHNTIVKLLKEAGAQALAADNTPTAQLPDTGDINQADATGFTPLFMALMTGDTAQMQTLINKGAQVNIKAPGVGTPLLYACSTGNVQAAQILVNAKANLNEANESGLTPLMLACIMGNTDLAQVLLAAGADTQIKQKGTGYTALNLAEQTNNSALINLIKEHTKK